jgi:dephospho-CoA kinase
MLLVGLTGGLATGKSTVARLFQQCGAEIIDADVVARQIVEPGKPAWRDLVRTFGTGILHADRTLNRQALAATVFRSKAKLRQLNAIMHPRVAREQARLTRAIAKTHPHAVVIYDAPVLIEAGAHTRMDTLLVITADQATQIARLKTRNGWSRAEALRRIRSQMPLREKVALAEWVIDGTRPLRTVRHEVHRLYQQFQAEAEALARTR